MDSLGGVDVFIANAGINEFTRIGKGGFDGSQRILQTNLIGTIATPFLMQGLICSGSPISGTPRRSE